MNAAAAGVQGAFVEPPFQLHMRAKVSDATTIHVESTSIDELARVMAFFNIGAQGKDGEQPAAATPPPPAAKTARGSSKAPAAPAPAPTAAAPASSSTPTAAPSAAAPQEPAPSSPSVTPQQAADAVRAFGGKHGIDKARALLKKHGFERTADITPDKAGAVHADATAEPQQEL